MASPGKALSLWPHRRRTYVFLLAAPKSHGYSYSLATYVLAGQLAIQGPGAERVSRKHVTITVDPVVEGHAVSLAIEPSLSDYIASLTLVILGGRGKSFQGHGRGPRL